jgi:transcriptional regulator, propionate catabolism operon regulatory protein
MRAQKGIVKESSAEKFMIIYPYKACGEMIKSMCPNFPYQPLLIDGENFNDTLKRSLDSLLKRGYSPDAIIGRGVVTSYASGLFPNSSIIRIDPTSMDILHPLKQARKYGDMVAILTYPRQGIEENVGMFMEIFDFRIIKVYHFQTSEDIADQVAAAKRDEMHSIIGGGTLGLDVARAHEIPATFIETSRASILKAVEQSVSIIESRRKEKEQLENITSILNCMTEGILATRNNRVLLSNSPLDEIMSVPVHKYYDKNVKNLNAEVERFIADRALSKNIITVGDKKYLAEKLGGKISWADNIVIFRNISELQDKEVNVRKSLHANRCTAKYTFGDILGSSPKILKAVRRAEVYASSDADILILGETGTGKELFAQSMHTHSARRDKPFVAVNCGAIPEQLLESELFGYAEGAFSGARKGGKAGLFELAHGGTIFLDEIDSLPIFLQGKLLRVIQEKMLRRLGSETEIIVDVRIISATNKDVASMIHGREFRSDLFYRIGTLILDIPSLRERLDDIEILANHFIETYSVKYKTKVPPLKRRKVELLKEYDWTGNVRELENVLHRYVVLFNEIEDDHLIEKSIGRHGLAPATIREDGRTISIEKGKLETMERAVLVSYLNECKWNRKEAADRLGISRSTLWRKLNRS